MVHQVEEHAEPTLAKLVAGEDLVRGDHVALLTVTYEYPSFLWFCEPHVLPARDPVVIRFTATDAGRPLRVLDACLPFVFVEQPCGKQRTLDLRTCELVRLDRDYAKRVWKQLARPRKQSKRKRRRC